MSTSCPWLLCRKQKEPDSFAKHTQFHHGEEMPHHILHGERPENLVTLPAKVLMDLLEITLPLNLLEMTVPLDLQTMMVPLDLLETMARLDLRVMMGLQEVALLDMINPQEVVSLHEEVIQSVDHQCNFNLPTQPISHHQFQIQQITLASQLQQLMFPPPWSLHLVQVFLFQMVCPL